MNPRTRNGLIVIGIALALLAFFVFITEPEGVTFTSEKNAPTVQDEDPHIGTEDAEITLVFFGDAVSEASGEVAGLLNRLLENETNIQVIFKDYPNNSLNEESLAAAIAARCAHAQDAFWEYHLALTEQREVLGEEVYTSIAESLDLKENSFKKCREDLDIASYIADTIQEGQDLAVAGAPTLFLGSQRISGSLSMNDLEVWINSTVSE